jgi:acyl-CoA hydrolase
MKETEMKIETMTTRHLVKGEDLNHHGTLYAGRGVEWMVEAGFIAASTIVGDEHVVCLRINSLLFRKAVPKGQMVTFESSVVHAGRTSLTVYVKVVNGRTRDFIVDGFFTFVRVNDEGRAVPHGIVIEPSNDEERRLHEEASALMEKAKAASPGRG